MYTNRIDNEDSGVTFESLPLWQAFYYKDRPDELFIKIPEVYDSVCSMINAVNLTKESLAFCPPTQKAVFKVEVEEISWKKMENE